MNNDFAIKVDNVSKKYCKSLKRSMLYGVKDIARNTIGLSSHSDKLRKNEFWALDDISFEVKKGETLGIIGPNGSGKTTLLKLLNGIFWPDKGKISIKGKVGALIEVGAGFHPLLTGRENIYINAAILGMTKEETDKKFNDIVDFADIGDFLDVPVKHYSSGMFVRLGFAVAIHCEPDILLVDEVLAVGDATFQSKCFNKIAELQKEGAAIIIVSHNMDTIRHVSHKALFLQNGKLKQIGNADNVVLMYLNNMQKEKQAKETAKILSQINENPITNIMKKGRINLTYFLNEQLQKTHDFKTGDFAKIRIEYEAFEEIENPVFAVHFYSSENLFISFISNNDGCKFKKLKKGKGIVEIYLEKLYLPAGIYTVDVVFSQDVEYNHIDWLNRCSVININKKEKTLGLVDLPHKWSIQQLGNNL